MKILTLILACLLTVSVNAGELVIKGQKGVTHVEITFQELATVTCNGTTVRRSYEINNNVLQFTNVMHMTTLMACGENYPISRALIPSFVTEGDISSSSWNNKIQVPTNGEDFTIIHPDNLIITYIPITVVAVIEETDSE